MKARFLLCTLLLAWTGGALCARPFSHLEYIQDTPPSVFLAYQLLHKNEITYCLFTDPRDEQALPPAHTDLFIQSALREWTYGIALRIRTAGRAGEMQDILDVLEKPLTLTRLPACDLRAHKLPAPKHPEAAPAVRTPDITFIASREYCYQVRDWDISFYAAEYQNSPPFICLYDTYAQNPLRSISEQEYIPDRDTPDGQQMLKRRADVFSRVAGGDYDESTQRFLWDINRFFSYDEQTVFSIIAHETGHAFGLGDEYLSSRPEVYSSAQPGEGLMCSGYQPVGCDEVDGMITLLDRFSGKKRTFASFCPERGLIVNGTEINRLEETKHRLADALRAAAAQ